MKLKDMRILKNKGFISIGIIIIILVVLGNFLISYNIILNKSNRLQRTLHKTYMDDIEYNLKVFSLDEVYRIDRSISDGSYRNPLEYFVSVGENSKLWFEKENTFSNNGFSICRASFIDEVFYKLNDSKNNDFLKSFKEKVKIRWMQKKFKIEVLKYYKLEERIEGKEGIISVKGIVSLEYKAKNQDIFHPDKEELEEIVIRIAFQ